MLEALRVIRDVVLGVARELGVVVRGIVLFGSRARGDYEVGSDWDVLVIVSDSTGRDLIRGLQFKAYRRLAERGIYCDIVVVRESYYSKYGDVAGTVAYYARREGRLIA